MFELVKEQETIEVTITNMKALLHQIVIGNIPETVCEISKKKLIKWIDSAGIKGVPGLDIKFNVSDLLTKGK